MTTLLLPADWPAPANVYAGVSTREGGVSRGEYASLNLGAHVQDEVAHVAENRRRLREAIPGNPALQWMRQVHGTRVHVAHDRAEELPEADALYTGVTGLALAVLTADCLPVCLTDRAGSEIAIAHAGWRGLVSGVIEAALERFETPHSGILAWLGPAIGPCHFEVGPEVKERFLAAATTGWEKTTAEAFMPVKQGTKYMADLYRLAALRLMAAGVQNISGGGRCTVCENDQFYSFRKSGVTGRFATVICRW